MLGREALALPGHGDHPTLALDLEAKLKMVVVHRVISTARDAGVEAFLALVETGSGPGTIAWQVYRPPSDAVGLMAGPNFGLAACASYRPKLEPRSRCASTTT